MADDFSALTIYLQRIEQVFDGETRTRMFGYIGERVGTAAEQRGVIYPPSPGGRPRSAPKFKSKKQQGYFFWALKSGVIKLPYSRTGNLARALTHHVSANANGATITIGTTPNVEAYAHWVIGDDQARYHEQTGWQKLQDDVDSEESELTTEAQRALDEFIQGLGI